MMKGFCLLLFILCYSMSAWAQGGPDLYVRDNYAFFSIRDHCRMVVSKSGPYSFGFSEYDTTNAVRRLQFISPMGGAIQHDIPGGAFDQYGPRFSMSSDGRNIAITDSSPTANVPNIWFSSDYGATFSRLPFTSTAPYTQPGVSSIPFLGHYEYLFSHFTFGPDNKLYVFYYSKNPSGTTPLNTLRLDMMVVDQSGAIAHTPISIVGGTAATFPIQATLAVTATATKIVATAWPGMPYYRRGATAADTNQAMLVVYDIATQTFDTMNYGVTGVSSLVRDEYLGVSTLLPENIKSDGTNVFMFQGLPWNALGAHGVIREFVQGASGNNLTFFKDTEKLAAGYQPTWQPFMDLTHPSIASLGVTTTALGGASGGSFIYDFGAPWNLGGASGHRVDVIYHTLAQVPPAVLIPDTYQRIRITSPNSGIGSPLPERLEDFPAAFLSTIGINTYMQPAPSLSQSSVPLVGIVGQAFCQVFDIPSWPLTATFFTFDLS